MEHLQRQLQQLLEKHPDINLIRDSLDQLVSVYPFNEYEYIISHLLANDFLKIDEYYLLRDEYLARNMFLYLFEISAPRTFGESWAQGNMKQLVPDLQKPSRKIDPNYTGQYDLWLSGIRIEIKASRVVDAEIDAPLYMKALSSDSRQSFWMNFQQIKPRCCDVFVWIAVWRDAIKYWIQSSYEVENSPHYSKGQHRGNIGEGQLHIRLDNIHDFDKYQVSSHQLRQAILDAGAREQAARSANHHS